MAEISTPEESTRTYHLRVFYRNVDDNRRITVTAYCSDDSGKPVESNDAFTHYEATWVEAKRSTVHRRNADKYKQCLSFQEAYEVARNSIQEYLWKTLGPDYSVSE